MSEYSRKPRILIEGDRMTIENYRDFSFDKEDVEERFMTATFDMRGIRRVWLLLEPFHVWRGVAHTLLSFEFEEGYVCVSVEARRKQGQKYDPIKGLFREYELLYVFGSERDMIARRTRFLGKTVYLYPLRFSSRFARDLLVRLAQDANAQYDETRYYHTLLSNCTTRLFDAAHAVRPGRIPWGIARILPGYADKYLYALGAIDTDLAFSQARERFRIKIRSGEPFSEAVRGS